MEGKPIERAHGVYIRALATTDPEETVRLAQRAIEISEMCTEAYALLARHAESPGEAKDLLRRGLRAAERLVGKGRVIEHAGDRMFWKVPNGVRYLNARHALADMLFELGETEEAEEHARAILKMDPTDLSCIRYPFAASLLARGRYEELRELLGCFHYDDTARWAYTRALVELCRTDAPLEGQRRAEVMMTFSAAIEANPHVPVYLLGQKPIPEGAEEAEVWGDLDSEASAYAKSSREVWRSTSGALELLEEAWDGEPAQEDEASEAWLYVWRESETEEPELAAYPEARESLLAARARDFGLNTRLAISPQGFRVFCVLGPAERVAEMAAGLLADDVYGFDVRVESEGDAEPFYKLGIRPYTPDDYPHPLNPEP